MKNGLIYGLFGSISLIIIFLIINAINPKLNFTLSTSLLINTFAFLVFMILAGLKERKLHGGYLGFGEAFLTTFIAYCIGSLVFNIFFIIYMNLNPHLGQVAAEASMEMAESTMRMTGLSEEQIALSLEEQLSDGDPSDSYAVGNVFFAYLVSIIIPGMIYILLASFITKKNPPTVV